MTLTFVFDLNSVKMNSQVKYPGQRSFSSKLIVQIHKHTDAKTYSGPIALPEPLNWSVG